MVGSLIYSLLRGLLDALATTRGDQARLQAEVLALRRQVQGAGDGVTSFSNPTPSLRPPSAYLSSSAVIGLDSHDDSQHRKRQRTPATVCGFHPGRFRFGADVGGRCGTPGPRSSKPRGVAPRVKVAAECSQYSNAGGKPWHLAIRGGTQRIRIPIFERAAAIC